MSRNSNWNQAPVPDWAQSIANSDDVKNSRIKSLQNRQEISHRTTIAIIRYRLARMALTTAILLLLGYAAPFVVERIQYAMSRGKQQATYDVATTTLKSSPRHELSKVSELVSQRVSPSVVHIHTAGDSPAITGRYNANIPESNLFPSRGQGAGVIVDSDGYVITNRHVVSNTGAITVQLSDRRKFTARVIGSDRLTDLALIKIDANDLIPINWASDTTIPVGTMVWAIGSPFGLQQSITFGIVSALHRTAQIGNYYQDFLQTDAAVNPGNSGGPLVNDRGELVGINTAIVGNSYQGVSFAVPVEVVRSVYERLVEHGSVPRGWLGVFLQNPSAGQLRLFQRPTPSGALITGFPATASPGREHGLKVGDLILQIDDTPVTDLGALINIIGNRDAGSSAQVTLERLTGDSANPNVERLTVAVTLGSSPAD